MEQLYKFKNSISDLMYEYDMSSFKTNKAFALKGKLPSSEKVSLDIVISLINMSINRLNTIGKLQNDEIDDYINHGGNDFPELQISEKSMTVYVTFLNQFINNAESAVADYVKQGHFEQYKKNPILNGSSTVLVKKQILNKGKDTDKVDFVDSYKKFEQNKMTIINISKKYIECVKDSDVVITNINSMLDNAIEDVSGDKTKINSIQMVRYVVIRSICEVISFTGLIIMDLSTKLFMDGVKISRFPNQLSTVINNVVEERAIATITNTDPHNVSSDFVKGNISAFSEIADNVIGLHKQSSVNTIMDEEPAINISNFVSSKKFDNAEADYNIDVYLDVAKAFISISTGLDIIAKEGDEYMMIFKDVLVKSGLSLDLKVRYGNEVKMVSDLSQYSSVVINEETVSRLCSELGAFKSNMETLSNIATEVYKKIEGIHDRYYNSVNREYNDTETVKNIIVFLEDFKTAFMDFCVDVCRSFIDRLHAIDNILKSVDSTNKFGSEDGDVELDRSIIIENADDYAVLALEDMFETNESIKELEFNCMEREYYKERMKEVRGVNIVFEADENKNGTSPTIVDNSTQGGNAQNQTGDKLKNFANNMGSNMSGFIKTLLDKFTNIVNRLKGTNGKWLADHESALNQRAYDNVTVNVLPYNNMDPNVLIQDINKLTNNVKSMTPQNLQNIKDKNDFYRKLFPFIPGGLSDDADNGIIQQLTTYYKVNKGKLEVVEMRNDSVKSFVTGKVIPFAKDYNEKYTSQLKSGLENLSKAVDDMIKSYGGAEGSQQNNTQQNNNNNQNNTENKNTASNITEKANWMSAAVKSFSGTALNVSRDRYNDYMKILKALAPTEQAQNNNNNNNQQNQNNAQQNENQ